MIRFDWFQILRFDSILKFKIRFVIRFIMDRIRFLMIFANLIRWTNHMIRRTLSLLWIVILVPDKEINNYRYRLETGNSILEKLTVVTLYATTIAKLIMMNDEWWWLRFLNFLSNLAASSQNGKVKIRFVIRSGR